MPFSHLTQLLVIVMSLQHASAKLARSANYYCPMSVWISCYIGRLSSIYKGAGDIGTAAGFTCSVLPLLTANELRMNHQIVFNNRRSVPSSSKALSSGQRIITIDAIVDVIFSFSTPRTIIALSQTCRAAHPIAASYFRVAYDPERFLHQFLPGPTDVRAFRSLQAQTGVVVFGKAARKFLARSPLTDTEMDLSVDESFAPQVNSFLTRAGYDVETRKQELVFSKKGEDEQIMRKIVLRVGPPESFYTLDKARDFPSGAWWCA